MVDETPRDDSAYRTTPPALTWIVRTVIAAAALCWAMREASWAKPWLGWAAYGLGAIGLLGLVALTIVYVVRRFVPQRRGSTGPSLSPPEVTDGLESLQGTYLPAPGRRWDVDTAVRRLGLEEQIENPLALELAGVAYVAANLHTYSLRPGETYKSWLDQVTRHVVKPVKDCPGAELTALSRPLGQALQSSLWTLRRAELDWPECVEPAEACQRLRALVDLLKRIIKEVDRCDTVDPDKSAGDPRYAIRKELLTIIERNVQWLDPDQFGVKIELLKQLAPAPTAITNPEAKIEVARMLLTMNPWWWPHPSLDIRDSRQRSDWVELVRVITTRLQEVSVVLPHSEVGPAVLDGFECVAHSLEGLPIKGLPGETLSNLEKDLRSAVSHLGLCWALVSRAVTTTGPGREETHLGTRLEVARKNLLKTLSPSVGWTEDIRADIQDLLRDYLDVLGDTSLARPEDADTRWESPGPSLTDTTETEQDQPEDDQREEKGNA